MSVDHKNWEKQCIAGPRASEVRGQVPRSPRVVAPMMAAYKKIALFSFHYDDHLCLPRTGLDGKLF
jgi:hypothetical protein